MLFILISLGCVVRIDTHSYLVNLRMNRIKMLKCLYMRTPTSSVYVCTHACFDVIAKSYYLEALEKPPLTSEFWFFEMVF